MSQVLCHADIHSHLLPGLDDGSKTLAYSAAALAALSRLGCTRLALTPHFYPSKTDLIRFQALREKAFRKVKMLPEAQKFRLSLGAEVYFSDTVFNLPDMDALCYSGTDFLLTELEYTDSFPATMEKRMDKLISNYSVTPIIAHIDRYPWLIGDFSAMQALRDMGCLMQINFGSFLHFPRRRKAFHAIDYGFVDFLGSDLHRTLPDEEAYNKAIRKLLGRYGEGFLAYASLNADHTIFQQGMVPADGEKTPAVSR